MNKSVLFIVFAVQLIGCLATLVRKVSYVSGRSVYRIQIGGGFVWAQYDRHLHRARLDEIR